MRTSGKQLDLPVLLVPLTVLIFVSLAFAADGGPLFAALERRLWMALHSVGGWVTALLS